MNMNIAFGICHITCCENILSLILEDLDNLDVTKDNISELANGNKHEVTLILGKKYGPVWSVLAC